MGANKADLISRAAALDKLDVTMRITAPDDYRLRISEAIEKLPAVDAAPVVHARWIKRKTWDNAVCSYCSFENANMTKYCPSCGARMDGERRDSE